MATLHKPPHILVFPYPAQGHMLALLDLTHHLATHGLTITILVTPKNLPILNPLLTSTPNIHPLVLPFPPHPTLPSAVENVKDIGNHGNAAIIASLARLRQPITRWFNSHPNPPVAIISDFFLGWTHYLAVELNIPRLAFFSVSALLISVLDYCFRNVSLVRSQDVTVFRGLPNSPAFLWDHLPTLFRACNESDPDWELVADGIGMNLDSWGLVVNTFDALEKQYLEYLSKMVAGQGRVGRVYGFGPSTLFAGSGTVTRGSDAVTRGSDTLTRGPGAVTRGLDTVTCGQLGAGSGNGSDPDVLRWLDGMPDGSVLYVCFGSQKFLTSEQMRGLGSGLEGSGVCYVWVVKLEDGELVGTGVGSGRGFVIKGWAPQVAILGHRAVGGFLTHCGWNSVMEAIVAGVMLLAWPMEADQFVNARLMVDDCGAAVRVCEGPDTVPDSAELARVIAESMAVEKSHKLKAKELKEKAIEAGMGGGSSSMALDRLVKDLSNLKPKTNAYGHNP